MLYKEFTELSKMEISYNDYTNVVEPMYTATEMSKEDFVKFIIPSVKPMAKKFADEKKKEQQKVVFVSDGRRTPNGSRYYGAWMMETEKTTDIRTGETIFKVRELTDEEIKDAGIGYTKEWNSNYSIDINTSKEKVNVKKS